MKRRNLCVKIIPGAITLGILVILLAIPALAAGPGGGGGKPPMAAGNNLSYPVIWAEGVTKVLRGEFGVESLGGVWWYWWGTDANGDPLSCAPDSENVSFCEDGDDNMATLPDVPPGAEAQMVYLQQDSGNEWQAESLAAQNPINVDWIDWGDNLESVDWYTRSQVRTEVVLIQDLTSPMVGYEMRHLFGLGIDEMHGTTGEKYDSTQATVYSPCARLTLQKLAVDRQDPFLADLEWVPAVGWAEPEGYPGELINDPIYNMAVYNGGDGPGYYSAEINVKGKIIFGYTWNVRRLNDGAGDYRITFSFDNACPVVPLNTHFIQGITEIVPLAEEEESVILALTGESPGGGGTAVIDFENNLTYMDVRILERGGGGGSGGGGGGSRGGGRR